MDTSTQTDFDFIAELWKFVKSRFAFQAKQLKHLSSQQLSQCYEVVAIGQGFSSWRGMSKVLESMCLIDRLDTLNDWDIKDADLPVRLSLAISDNIDQIHVEDEIKWKVLERILSSPPARKGRADFEVFDGIISANPLRSSLFYKAAWMGQGAPWSTGLIDEAYACTEYLEELWDGDIAKAWLAVTAMYGEHPGSRAAIWDFSPVVMAEYNFEVDRILTHGGSSSRLLVDAAPAYRLAKSDGNLDIGGWRTRLREVHPGSLDFCLGQSFIPSLLMANGPNDAWVSIGLDIDGDADEFHEPVHIFLPELRAYAPSPQKAAQLAACLESMPSISKLTTDEARDAGLPIGDANWHLVQTF